MGAYHCEARRHCNIVKDFCTWIACRANCQYYYFRRVIFSFSSRNGVHKLHRLRWNLAVDSGPQDIVNCENCWIKSGGSRKGGSASSAGWKLTQRDPVWQGSQTHLSMWAAVEDNSQSAGRTTKCNCFTQHCSYCS